MYLFVRRDLVKGFLDPGSGLGKLGVHMAEERSAGSSGLCVCAAAVRGPEDVCSEHGDKAEEALGS